MQTFMSLTFVDLCLKKQCAFSRSLKSLQVSNPWTGLYQIPDSVSATEVV